MLKKTCTLGLLAAAALVSTFSPAAQANQIQVNKQSAAQNASAVGTGNVVDQNLNQTSLQDQFQVPGYPAYYHANPGAPQVQVSDQEGVQNGAAVGAGNYVDQHLQQTNLQDQFKF